VPQRLVSTELDMLSEASTFGIVRIGDLSYLTDVTKVDDGFLLPE